MVFYMPKYRSQIYYELFGFLLQRAKYILLLLGLMSAKYLHINNCCFQHYYNHNSLGTTPTALIKRGAVYLLQSYKSYGL